ncbi:hypothetical protein [Cohnella phaseoli]|uniref:hypothetical protein n=1 Tax=Cohnella phaseoli TaxID=456490 RepID=UPI000E249FB9|nr:hypothetical protein [Cohnella phaseoli]
MINRSSSFWLSVAIGETAILVLAFRFAKLTIFQKRTDRIYPLHTEEPIPEERISGRSPTWP